MRTLMFALFCLAVAACSQPKESQTNAADPSVGRMIKNQEYTFTARTVLPTGGRLIQLTSSYDLTISKDSLISFLPYFGRAYSAPIGGSNPGLQFTSVNYSHKVKERKNGGWQISIRPNDVQDIQQMNLTVSEGGSASLQVTSNNRQPVSYNGIIEER